MVLISALLALALGQVTPSQVELIDFSTDVLPEWVMLNHCSLERTAHAQGYAARVRFDKTDWPNVFFKAPEGIWDWQDYAGVAVSLYNPESQSVAVTMRVDNAGADGVNHCNNAGTTVPAHGRCVLSMQFNTGKDQALWGMRGIPNGAPVGTGDILDTEKITAFQVYLPRPQEESILIFERAWLIPKQALEVSFPFIDAFGQYRHADWPGKLKHEAELVQRHQMETKLIQAHPRLKDRDKWGGWAQGPRRKATGWFRTEKIDGKWWLVTPDGTLFLSVGVDCVGTWSRTFVTGRETWFSWLPDRETDPYKRCFSYQKNAHSGADIIDGKGWTFGFYAANLMRKYGTTWEADWREHAYARLQSWGFNTIANWSQHDVLDHATMPYVVSASISGVRPIEKGTGYWSKMIDVFAPEFPQRVRAALQGVGRAHGHKPLCIGYFVDNELSWNGIRNSILESPPDQPCRIALIDQLRASYGTIEKLNTAWNSHARNWDQLGSPHPRNDASSKDLDHFLYRFAKCYFETVKTALHGVAPHQLYLGCRFAGRPPRPVERAAAQVLDVISYNLYFNRIPQDQWVGDDDLGKPLIIGEFHFGALDRGMFHTGLVATQSQQERADSYARYLRSVADHPAFVGCHWFQYVDEPSTGRWFDGENYNIGFVDITDTPYPEMIESAKTVHDTIYQRRYTKGKLLN
jgi:hypothetical protein